MVLGSSWPLAMEPRFFAPQTVYFFLILMQFVAEKQKPDGQPLTQVFAALLLTALLALGGFFDGALVAIGLMGR